MTNTTILTREGPHEREISILDTENPYSILNKVPPRIREAVLEVEDDLLLMDPEDLRQTVRPNASLNSLRRSFWEEYDRACRGNRKMVITTVFNGIMKRENFYRTVLTNTKKMAWLLTPPLDHKVSQEELYESTAAALRQAVQLLTANLVNKKGEVNVPAVKTLMQMHKDVEQRIYGAVTQKIEQKTLSLRGTLPKEAGSIDIEKDLLELKKELLENKIKEDPNFGET